MPSAKVRILEGSPIPTEEGVYEMEISKIVTVSDLIEALKEVPEDTPVYTGEYYYESREGTCPIQSTESSPILLNSEEFPQKEVTIKIPLNPRPGQVQKAVIRTQDAVRPLMWYNGDVLFLDTYEGPNSYFKTGT
jgi:hypothetical protein